MTHVKLVALFLLCTLPLAAFAAEEQPQHGKWWCESDAAQPPIYMSGWDVVTATSAALAREFAQVLAQSYSYKGSVACYLDLGTHSLQDYGTHIQIYKDAGKKMIGVPWKPPSSEPAAAPQPSPAPHAAVAAQTPPAATAPAPAQAPAAQAPSNRPPYICVANMADARQSPAATLYVTAPFDVATPQTDVVHAWRAYVAAQYKLANVDAIANCSRRDDAKRDQLEAQIAKVKGPVARVSWKP